MRHLNDEPHHQVHDDAARRALAELRRIESAVKRQENRIPALKKLYRDNRAAILTDIARRLRAVPNVQRRDVMEYHAQLSSRLASLWREVLGEKTRAVGE